MATSAKLRSPRYPVIGLPEAIEKVAMVYKKDFRNKIGKELVAEHIGYSGLNGKSLGVISAISKYGLLEGGRDSMWVTSRAVDIIEREKSDPERRKALLEAAASPEAFKEIDSNFPGKASDQAIRSFLITKLGYLPESADKLVRTYRDTRELVEVETAGYDSSESAEEVEVMHAPEQPRSAPVAEAVARSHAPTIGGDEREWLRGPLSRDTSYRLIVAGDLGPRELGKLIKLLQAQKDVLSDEDEED